MTTEERVRVLRDLCRRSKQPSAPTRSGLRASDLRLRRILSDYGAFRDLQRHRILTIDWQTAWSELTDTTASSRDRSRLEPITEWRRRHGRICSDLHRPSGREAISPLVAQYAVSMAYRIRFYMHMNAREAMHVIELRTAPQGHPAYRRVCQTMHTTHRRAGGAPGDRRGHEVRRPLRRGAWSASRRSARANDAGRRCNRRLGSPDHPPDARL